eukprot:g5982.t1
MKRAFSTSLRRSLTHSKVNTVAIVGGTHGNELNGIALANYIAENPHLLKDFTSYEVLVLLANPSAIELNVRYCEHDLNRCFKQSLLSNTSNEMEKLEMVRAKDIDEVLGPKNSMNPRADFIFDFHNTTSNTGVALMMAPDDDFAHEVGAYLQNVDPSVRIVDWSVLDSSERPLLPSIGRSGMTFEVGPAPHGCLMGREYDQTRRLLFAALQFLHEHNEAIEKLKDRSLDHSSSLLTGEVEVFQTLGSIDYLRKVSKSKALSTINPSKEFQKETKLERTANSVKSNSTNIVAMIHPDLQNKDFCELLEGSPLFLRLNGETIHFNREMHAPFLKTLGIPTEEPVYPFFINEAAYYEKNIALKLGRKSINEYKYLSAKK